MHYASASIELARSLYEDSAITIRDIAALSGVGERTITRHAAAEGWRRRGQGPVTARRFIENEPGERAVTASRNPSSASGETMDRRRKLVARLWDAVERQISDIEQRLDRPADDASHRLAAQEFALISRTMQHVALLDRAVAPEAGQQEFPTSDDELQRDLLRKLDALVARRADPVPGKPDGG